MLVTRWQWHRRPRVQEVHAVTGEPIVPILAASRLAVVTGGWPAVPAMKLEW
jgi:hypothetical protein